LVGTVVGSALLGIAKGAQTTSSDLANRNWRRTGAAPIVLQSPPPQVLLPGNLLSLSLAPTDYFQDPDSGGFTLIVVEKDQEALPSWMDLKFESVQLVGTYDTQGTAHGVQVVGNFAYVADGGLGLQIIDISNPAVPTLSGAYDTPGSSYSVQVVGNLAYVADNWSGLSVIDVSNPATPTLRGSYDTPGTAYGVQVVGNLTYVADGGSGLQIIDVSNPAVPTLTGTYDTPGSAYGVQVVGNFAYVADYTSDLQIIDISNPAAPTLTSTHNTPGYAYGVQVVGNFAYIADGGSGLQIIDVSNPAAPALTGTYDTLGSAIGVYVVGNLAYVADGSSGLSVIDVSNPVAPTLTGTYDTPGLAYGVHVVGNLAYVADGLSGLLIIEEVFLLSGIPHQTEAGNYELELIAVDPDQNQAFSTFLVRVEGPPVASGSIPNKLLNVGISSNFFIDQSIFPDPNADVVFYSAKQTDLNPLPSWLNFSPIGIFLGAPTSSDVGTYYIEVQAYDGIVQDKASRSFNLTVDHFPQKTTPLSNQVADIDNPFLYTLPSSTFTDQDVGDTLTYTATLANENPLPAWLNFNPATRQFSGTPTTAGSYNIKVKATDNAGAFAQSSFNLVAENFPELINPLTSQLTAVGESYSYPLPGNTFSDQDGDPLTYRATKADGSLLPRWLGFVGARLEFQGVPLASDKGTISLKVIAEDPKGGSAFSLFDLKIVDALSNEKARIGGSFVYGIPNDMIDSPLGSVTYSVTLGVGSPLPPWLIYNPITNVITGIPPNGSEGFYNILVTADDGVQAPVSGTLTLNVGPNAAPKVANPLSSQVAQVGQSYSFAVPDNTFADPNGDTLTLSATRVDGRSLPSWLTFADRILSGKPGRGNTGPFTDKTFPLKVCATDGDEEACSVFDLSVQGTSNAELALSIFGPLAAVGGLFFGWYKKRGLFLNPWNRENYDKGTKTLFPGVHFSYKFEAPADKIKLVKAYKERRMLAGLPTLQYLDERGYLEWLKTDRALPGGALLPRWLKYNIGENMLISSSGPGKKDNGCYILRAYGNGEVILEQVTLDVGFTGGE
jgi:hypothetical protein